MNLISVCYLKKPISALKSMNVQGFHQRVIKDTQSSCLGPNTKEARVINQPIVTLQVPECTANQRVSENIPQASDLSPTNQQVSETTPLHSQKTPMCSVAEPTHYSVLGLPIVHLSLILENPPWTQLTQRGIIPMAETICQSSQTFAGRISLFSLNWKALTQETWVNQTVMEGYHIPLMSLPNQCSPPPKPSPVLRGHYIIGGGDTVSPAETGHLSDLNSSRGILLEHVHSAQERWGSETCHQPKALEQTCEIRAFQDGGPAHSQSSIKERRLDGKGGPERCILHGPNSLPIPTSSPLQDGEEDIPVQLSPFRLVHSPESIHEDTQASHRDAQITEHSTSNLHGRHASNGRLQAKTNGARPVYSVPPREPRVHYEQQEVHLATHEGNRVPGNDCKLPFNGPKIARRENQENQARSTPPVTFKATISSTTLPAPRETKRHLSSPANGSPILSFTPDLPKTSSVRQSAELPGSSSAVPSSTGGPSVVGTSPLLLEWKKPDHPANIIDNNIGCIPTRLGGHLQWQSDQRSMVPIRTVPPHQLPGTTSSHLGSSVLHKREIRHFNPPANRQLNSSCLHQQEGGNSITKVVPTNKGPVVVVHGEEYPPSCSTSTGNFEHHCRRGVQNMVRQVRVETLPNPIPGNQSSVGTSVHRPVCKQAIVSAPSICELETRPPSSGHRCLYSGLEHPSRETVCQSTLGSDRQSPIPSSLPRGSGASTGSTSLESPTMVSHAPPNAGQSTSPHPTVSRHTQPVCQDNLPDIIPQLAVWVISTNNAKATTFLRQLQTLSSHQGETNLQSHTIPPLGNGLAGVLNGTEIPFQAL